MLNQASYSWNFSLRFITPNSGTIKFILNTNLAGYVTEAFIDPEARDKGICERFYDIRLTRDYNNRITLIERRLFGKKEYKPYIRYEYSDQFVLPNHMYFKELEKLDFMLYLNPYHTTGFHKPVVPHTVMKYNYDGNLLTTFKTTAQHAKNGCVTKLITEETGKAGIDKYSIKVIKVYQR